MAEFGYVLLFINILLYFFRIKEQKEKPYKILFSYLLTIGFLQIIVEYYQNKLGGNLFLTHYYFISQSLLFSFFYYIIIKNQKIKTLIKIVVPITIGSLTVQYYLYPELYYVFNVYEIFICIFPIVIYALSHLFQTHGSPNKKYIYITSGILIYFLPHALVFSSGNLMPGLPSNVNQIIWLVNAVLYLIFLLLIFIEWYKHFRKPKKEIIEGA
jgi:hypothetical protein